MSGANTIIVSRLSEHLGSLVAKACTDLFATWNVRLDRPSEFTKILEPNLETMAGGQAIFDGTSMRGTLLLVASFDFMASCRPKDTRSRLNPSSAADWILIRDWSMELANQLLGRIKNRLYVFGTILNVRSPTAVSGHPLNLAMSGRQLEPLVFTYRREVIRVWFDVAGSRVDLPQKPNPVELPKEGDVILF